MSPKTGTYVGIGISVGIVLIICAIFLAFRMRGSSIGDPVATKEPGMFNKIDMNLDLSKVTTLPPTGTGAEVPYGEMVKLAEDFGVLFPDKIDAAVHPEEEKEFKAMLDKLEEGADKGLADGPLNFDALPALSPQTEWDIRGTLKGLGTIGTRSAMSMRMAKNKAGADKALRAALIWGYRLFKNGEPVAYRSASMACVSEALAEYQSHYSKQWYNDPAKADAAKELYDIYLPVGKHWAAKQMIVWVPKMDPAPGDLWNLAEHDQDKMWRAEAIMWMGIAQWTSVPSGNQRAAIQAYLNEKSKSSDPVIAKCAKEAVLTPRETIKTLSVRR